MLTHPTLNQLQELKLIGMAEAFADLAESPQAKELSHAEWLASTRTNKRLNRLLRAAKLREAQAAVEDLDAKASRKLDKVLFRELATCRWIKESRNLIITGPCGIGKTWLACALGQKACRENLPTIYKRVPRLFEELELGHHGGAVFHTDATVASRACLGRSPRPSCSFWMTGVQINSMASNAVT